jgi:hypothetical protein
VEDFVTPALELAQEQQGVVGRVLDQEHPERLALRIAR